VNVASLASLPAGSVSAMFMNATTGSLEAGYLQVFPTGKSTPGASSNVNVGGPGPIRANAVITRCRRRQGVGVPALGRPLPARRRRLLPAGTT
jgi:hypothetical protein